MCCCISVSRVKRLIFIGIGWFCNLQPTFQTINEFIDGDKKLLVVDSGDFLVLNLLFSREVETLLNTLAQKINSSRNVCVIYDRNAVNAGIPLCKELDFVEGIIQSYVKKHDRCDNFSSGPSILRSNYLKKIVFIPIELLVNKNKKLDKNDCLKVLAFVRNIVQFALLIFEHAEDSSDIRAFNLAKELVDHFWSCLHISARDLDLDFVLNNHQSELDNCVESQLLDQAINKTRSKMRDIKINNQASPDASDFGSRYSSQYSYSSSYFQEQNESQSRHQMPSQNGESTDSDGSSYCTVLDEMPSAPFDFENLSTSSK